MDEQIIEKLDELKELLETSNEGMGFGHYRDSSAEDIKGKLDKIAGLLEISNEGMGFTRYSDYSPLGEINNKLDKIVELLDKLVELTYNRNSD